MKRLKLDIQLFAEEDGWVTIGAKLDSKQLEKDLKNEQSKLEKFEKEAEKLTQQKAKIDIEVELKGKEFDRKVEEIKAKAEAQKIGLGTTTAADITKREKIDATAQAKINSLTQQYNQYLEQADNKIKDIDKKLEENAHQQGLVNNNISEMSSKLKQVSGFEAIKGSVDGVGNSLQKVTKRIAKMAVAVFGIRSAFMFVRNAINTIAGDDKQLQADIDYMKSALAYTIEPIVRGIVNLAKQLMFYVAYIIKAWTGKNIFANANKGLGNAAKKAKKLNKELNKTLTSFDEMNVMNDNSSGNDNDGISTPSFDLTNLEDVPIPSWVKWIADNKDLVIAGLMGIAAGLTAVKLGATGLMALGIGLAVAGIVYAVMSLVEYLKDPSWENFGKVITGIGVAITGVAIAFGLWPLAAAGAIVAVLGIIISNWEKIKSFLQNGIDWLTDKSDWIHEHLGDTIGNIYDNIVQNLQKTLNWFDLTFKSLKGIFDGIIKFVKGAFTGDWKMAWEGIKQIFGNIWNWISGTAKLVLTGLIDKARSIAYSVGNVIANTFRAVVNSVLRAVETVLNSPIRAINRLISTINDVPGINLKRLSTFNLPRLAKGGIVNMPGRGVPVGGALTGEVSREGVIPLTDAQQMNLLGEAIGKYITVNLTNITELDGRQIARKVDKIQQNNNFVFNR